MPDAFNKTIESARLLHFLISEEFSESELKERIKKKLGPSWSLTSAFQFLTGRAAISILDNLPDDFLDDGLTKVHVLAAFAVAHDYCAKSNISGAMINGLKVSKFLNKNELTYEDRILALLKKNIN